MRKRLIILGEYLLLLVAILLAIHIFNYSIQYADSGEFIFERPSDEYITVHMLPLNENKEVAVYNNIIIINGEYIIYETTRKGFSVYDIDFFDINGELVARASYAPTSKIRFLSRIDNMIGGSASVSNEDAHNLHFLTDVVLMNLRYQELYNRLLILLIILLPVFVSGYILNFKPLLLKRFVDEYFFNVSQLYKRKVKGVGRGLILASILVPFVLLIV